MFLANASIKRPIAMGCLLIALALLGINALRKMNLELLPQIDIPYITVTVVYPGASPEEIEVDIARRIEDAVSAVNGLRHVTSYSMENVCQVLLEFELEVDVDVAAMDVREQIDLVRAQLPAGAEAPIILKMDIGATPVATLALTGDASLADLYDYADDQLRDQLAAILGVADITLVGGAPREVHILLDREELAARGLTSAQVAQAVERNIGSIPAGRLRDDFAEYSISFRAEYEDLEMLESIVLASQNANRVYLGDVGRAVMGTAELRQTAELNGQPAVILSVVKRADANAVAVIRRVEDQISRIQATLPADMELVWVADNRTLIESMNRGAWLNVLQGILMTGAILFFFLYNVRSMLIIALTMPLTILVGILAIHAMGFSLNATTLMAIGMSVGILVTNSIVVLEAIIRQLESHHPPPEAARIGAAKAFVPVLASAGTNMVVLFPISIMGSLFGRIISFFSMTLLVMTIVSLFVSFTLTPMLCALLLKPREAAATGLLVRMENAWNRWFDKRLRRYRQILGFLEQRRWAAILVVCTVALLFLHALWLLGRLGSEGTTDIDGAEILVKIEFPTHFALERTRDRVLEASQQLESLPHLQHMITRAGGVQGEILEGAFLGSMQLYFSQRDARRHSIHDLVADARHRLRNLPDAVVTVSIPDFAGAASADIELEIAGPSLEQLDRYATSIQSLANQIPGFTDVETSVRSGKPEWRITPNLPVLADMGIAPLALGSMLRGNIEGLDAGTFKSEARNFDIIVKMDERPGIDQIRAFAFPGDGMRPITIESLAEIDETQTLVQITRKNKQRIALLTANLLPSLPMGSAVEQLSAAIEQNEILPPGYEYQFVGMYEIMTDAMHDLGEAGLIALILVILTLSAILESFRQPLLILVTIPLTMIGIAWSLTLSNSSMEIFVMMSAIMMMGIVVNNAILIVDQFNVYVREGEHRHRAMIRAASEQFRPVIMITIAAVLGMLPMAISRAIGAEFRNAAGMASVGGILVSGLLTLILLPVLYDLCTRNRSPSQ